MQQSKQFDIAVVGAGLVGGSAALALARLAGELNIALIDAGAEPQALAAYQCANPEVADFDPRVVALTRSSEEFFQSLGVWRAVAETRIGPYTNMAVWDGEGTARIEFDCC
ncbi:MAG: 2-octaprenyl-3-methyl-6-methoxy-1,4-benzoquinol hydroxylase, partial [Cellvibrionaceae bacterium]|nr:2-octaprenyl-3-methyl-6-methoxy-1,4-benzoquinol hydroxylase [Cellvibrionaceae bacterium]